MTTKRAVLIGIDEYEVQGQDQHPRKDTSGNDVEYRNLRGCVNDVLAIREYLIRTLKVPAGNIDTLLAPVLGTTSPYEQSSEVHKLPTYKNIVGALQNLARTSAAGDIIYIHYSGHGACATTVFESLRQGHGNIDHCLVPWDIKQGGKYLRDLELGALLQEIVAKAVVLTVVLDSCFSGGAVRGEDDDEEVEGVRGVRGTYLSDQEIDVPDNMDRVQHWAGKASWLESPSGFVTLAACLDYQKAKEYTCKTATDIYIHGYLSYWLLDTLRNTSTRLSSRAIYDRVRSKIAEKVASQTPYIIGDLRRFFFDEAFRSRVHTLTVLHVDEKQRQWLRLDGGRMDAVYIHSVYAILPLSFDPATPISESDILAKVRIERMKSRECRAVFLQPESITDLQWQKLDVGCPAVLQSLPLGGTAGVRFIASNEAQAVQFPRDWDHSLKGREKLCLSTDDDAQFRVQLDHEGCYQINCVGDIFPAYISNTLAPLSGDKRMPKLISRLEHIARFKLLRGLENPHIRLGNLPDLAYVTLEPSPDGEYADTEKSIWIPAAQSIGLQQDGVYRVQQKELFRFKVTNNSDNTIGCVILNFNPEMGISVMHENLFHSIAPHDQLDVDLFVGISDTLQAAAARAIPIVDTFKIFVSVPEKDMSAMALQKLRVAEDEGYWRGNESAENLDDLLQELAPLCRDGAFPLSRQPKMDDDWQTFDFHIQALV
ncbi:hypothetical protein J4E85_010438 [Alternaria conjuncta]|uniref:uncharacterized protein n=1 Tax=Alternaria conjuncta TaxID=181017 RepID=UPI00221E7A66|nr:uncharacterized protein J4E85_010438 [Alternaria conjuncta]KAI4915313.1 hypothetical protein J4E85_010438 [Alternaria conjuncta]